MQAAKSDSTFAEPCVEVYRPDASLIGTVCESNNPRLDLALDQSGTYVIVVSDDNDDETFNYNLALETIIPLSCTTTPICYGCSLPDSITPIGDLDLYAFVGATGDQLMITASGTSGFGEPCLELFDSTGGLAGTDCDSNDSMVVVSAPNEGVYTVLVSDDNDDETLAYTLTVQCLGLCPPTTPICGLIFDDGFESGDTGAWSSAVP